MHIGHVITKLDVGGAQSVVCELARHQLAGGHQVTVWTGFMGPSAERLRHLGAEVAWCRDLVHSPNPKRDASAVRILTREFSAAKLSIVHAHSSKGGLVGRMAGWRAHLPVVYTAHGWPFHRGAPALQRSISVVSELVLGRVPSHLVVVTEDDLRLASRLRIGRKDRRHLVYNGTAGPTVGVAAPSGESLELIYVGRLAAPKRVDLLLDAIRLLPGVRLTVVGGGPDHDYLRSCSLDLGDRVRWIGECAPGPFLAKADVFTLISDHEGLPMSVLEAMSYGLPFIANDLPGLREVLTFGEVGRLVKKNASSFAAAVEMLDRDRTSLEAMAKRAAECWADRYTADSMSSEYLAVYEDACAQFFGKNPRR